MRKDWIDEAWAAINAAALAGDRCPKNDSAYKGLMVHGGAVVELARLGRLRSEVSGRNYRTVYILDGENAGKNTAPDPSGYSAWLVVSKAGTFRHGEPARARRGFYQR